MSPVRTAGGNVKQPELAFRGFEFCDGCGAKLEPESRLSGLCPACQEKAMEHARPKARQGAPV